MRCSFDTACHPALCLTGAGEGWGLCLSSFFCIRTGVVLRKRRSSVVNLPLDLLRW